MDACLLLGIWALLCRCNSCGGSKGPCRDEAMLYSSQYRRVWQSGAWVVRAPSQLCIGLLVCSLLHSRRADGSWVRSLCSVHMSSFFSSRRVSCLIPLESSGAACLNGWDQFLLVVMLILAGGLAFATASGPASSGGVYSKGPKGSSQAAPGNRGSATCPG